MVWLYNNDLSAKKNYEEFEKVHSAGAQVVSVCPVCGGTSFDHFSRQIIRCRNPNFEWVDTALQICGTCGTIMSDRIYQPEYYFEYINNFYDTEVLELFPGSFIKPKSRRDFLATALTHTGFKPQTILEIGCFEGATLDIFKYEYDADVYGIEPTTKTLEKSLLNFPHLQGRVYNDVFERSSDFLAGKKFDLILSSYSFRQNAHPIESLELINDLIADDGFLYLDEGHFQDVFLTASDVEIGMWFYQQKNFYYSMNSLIYLLEKYGFEYFASLCRHEADYKTGYQPRHVALIFRRNTSIVPNGDRIIKSKVVSDALVSYFKSKFPTEDKVIEALNTIVGVT